MQYFGLFVWRAQASGLRPFGKCAKASPSPASFPPNKSFKPTPCRGFVETSGHASNTGSQPPRSARLNSGVMRGLAAGCAGSPQLQLHQSSRCSAAKHSSLLSVRRSRRSPSGETALRLAVRARWPPLDETIRTGQFALQMGGALGFGGRSWPPTIIAPSCVNRLPIVCANKSWRNSCFAGLRVVA